MQLYAREATLDLEEERSLVKRPKSEGRPASSMLALEGSCDTFTEASLVLYKDRFAKSPKTSTDFSIRTKYKLRY